jgi:hypothetical protein
VKRGCLIASCGRIIGLVNIIDLGYACGGVCFFGEIVGFALSHYLGREAVAAGCRATSFSGYGLVTRS